MSTPQPQRPAEAGAATPKVGDLDYDLYESLEAAREDGHFQWWTNAGGGWPAEWGHPAVVSRVSQVDANGDVWVSGIPGSLETSEPAAKAIVTAVNERPALLARLAAAEKLAVAAQAIEHAVRTQIWQYNKPRLMRNLRLALTDFHATRLDRAREASGAPAATGGGK